MLNDIVFVHLLNDFSGSPKVLKETIRAVALDSKSAVLYLGSSDNGILSTSCIPITRYWYHRTKCRILTPFTYLLSQVVLFFKLLGDHSVSPNAIIYVNTILPFGAAVYGKLTGRKVVFHVHEISVAPALLKYFLTRVMRRTSSLNIYVSDAHMQALPIPGVSARRVYNALDADFLHTASASVYANRYDGFFNVLMVASLREYKGIHEFMALASALVGHTEIRFDLVINDDQEIVDRFLASRALPGNLAFHSRTSDTSAYYSRACLVLNLSRVYQCVETFGMTILEAMAFGIPVIVPPVGGPVELVRDGVEGFHVDSRDLRKLLERVLQLSRDEQLCMQMSKACRERATDFSPAIFADKIMAAIEN